MRPLADIDLGRFVATAESSLSQTCTPYAYSGDGVNPFGEPEVGYTKGAPLPCGFEYKSSKQNDSGEIVTEVYDALLRVARGAITDSRSRIDVDGVMFSIVSIEPRMTISLLKLRRMNSDGEH